MLDLHKSWAAGGRCPWGNGFVYERLMIKKVITKYFFSLIKLEPFLWLEEIMIPI